MSFRLGTVEGSCFVKSENYTIENMARLLINNQNSKDTARARALAFRALSGEQKLERLFSLIRLAQKLKKGYLLKQPQGKGLIIRKVRL